jgi:D-alanyl-D-alanine dipeptidase
LVDKNNNEIDMGTEFDNFSAKAHRDAFEKKLITKEQENNRQLLNFVMGEQFIGYSKEWWHYNIEMTDENKVKYPKITDL